jgi:nucleotide-binding universal stress UspA family protein
VSGYSSVVVAIDFSPASRRVLENALRVTDPLGTLHLVHVVEWVPTMVEGAFAGYTSPREMRTLRDASIAKLATYVPFCGAVRTTTDAVEGNAAPSILEAAERFQADLLVIGTQGRSRTSRLLMGRVMERILRQAQCPVLVVR